MISVEDARARILASVQPLFPIRVALPSALGAFLAEEIRSPIDLPPFDNSAMDGYAVRSEDLKEVSGERKVTLPLAGRLAAGDATNDELPPGHCFRLFTGSKMPPGANAVVMQEDVVVTPHGIVFSEPAKPLENVRLKGEDVRSNTLLARAHEELNGNRMALLAATGHVEVSVHKPASVALLATGNEIREPGQPLRPGEIYESNRVMLRALIEDLGATAVSQPIVRDTLDDTVAALRTSFDLADVLISTGGVSVGELDFVKEAFQQIGGSLELWRVAMRPGKPFVFGRLGEKFLFGLPGNPVSAFVTFLLFVRPALLKMQGAEQFDLPKISGELAEPIANRGDRRHFARVRWNREKIELAGPQKSHMIGSLAAANALLDLEPGVELLRGSQAEVLVFEKLH